MNQENFSQQKKNILEFTFLDDGKIRLSLSESRGQGPLAFYQETEVAIERIDGLVREINGYLNKINGLKNQDQSLLSELQKTCQLLYNELLSQEIKGRLQNTTLNNLELILDEHLVHIPWELLFDGQKFFCEQFSIGRQVRTKGSKIIHHSLITQIKLPLKMLIIADPTEDLEVAWQEGAKIYEKFQQKQDLIRITLQSADQVDLDFVKKNLWDYDLVHYAGHADYNPLQPQQSGWVLSDGKLSAEDIIKMSGAKRVMPKLVFGNACQSGYTEKWEKQKDPIKSNHQSYGLVHAFLMVGVQYYLGAFCDVSDEYGAYMGIEFYDHLLRGNTIGEALRLAKESFREKFGDVSSSWINYVLYGHPGDYLISPEALDTPQHNRIKKTSRESENSLPDKANKISTHLSPGSESEQAMPSLRHSRLFLPQRKKWMGTAIVFLFFLIFTAIVIFFPDKHSKNQATQNNSIVFDRKQQRIEELKRMIYTKLKAREEKPESSSRAKEVSKEGSIDKWTSKPIVIAIFSLFDQEEDNPLPDWAIRTIKDMDKKLNGHFVEDAWIRVAERKELDKLLEEKDLELSDFSFGDQKDLFARFLYTRVMLFLEGYQSSEGLSLCYKVVDAETGEIDKIDSSVKLSRKEILSDSVKSIYTQARQVIYAKYPLRGRIAAIQDKLVVLNIGAEVGIRKGDIFEVFSSDNQGFKRKRIGKIKVTNETIDQTTAQCEILEGRQLEKGLRVEVADK